jgi:hypothetical protein
LWLFLLDASGREGYALIGKIFISWSGERSRQVGLVFRKWLPTVINYLKPWVSDVDLPKGAEWSQQCQRRLNIPQFPPVEKSPLSPIEISPGAERRL